MPRRLVEPHQINHLIDKEVGGELEMPGAEILLRIVRLQSTLGIYGELVLAFGDPDDTAISAGYSNHTVVSDGKGGFKAIDAPGRFKVYADCSDCFMWGSADSEEITLENWPVFVTTLKDCYPIFQKILALNDEKAWTMSGPIMELFCARIRGMRPQGASYSYVPYEMWPLFDVCGPNRTTGLGNPTEPGHYSNGPWFVYNEKRHGG